VVTLADSVTVIGTGRGDKPREEVLKNSPLAAHVGKRARKGKAVDGFKKVLRLA
jgi:topoisomerase-4 subunit A